MTKKKQGTLFEDGNRLIGSNSDNGGLANVNWNWPDNRNGNIGFRPLIVSHCFTSLIQPPSILPIPIISDTRLWYLLLSRHLVSQDSLKSNFIRSSLMLAFCKIDNFCSRGEYPAAITNSMVSKISWSNFCPSVYRFAFGKRTRN